MKMHKKILMMVLLCFVASAHAIQPAKGEESFLLEWLTDAEIAYYNLVLSNAPVAANYLNRTAEYEAFLPQNPERIFLGDSITYMMPVSDMFEARSYNRGIGGDKIDGLRARLSNIVSVQPERLYVLIGINDMWSAIHSVGGLCSKYYRLFEAIAEQMPATDVFIQSVLPINSVLRPDLPNAKIRNVNQMLKELCVIFDFHYIDLHPFFVDENGEMQPEFAEDGLHLSLLGMERYAEAMKPYVDEDAEPDDPPTRDVELDDIRIVAERKAELLFSFSMQLGEKKQYTECAWAYSAAGEGTQWNCLAQYREGKLLALYNILRFSYPEDDILLRNSVGALALIPTASVQPQDTLVLMDLQGTEAILAETPLWFY